MPINRSEVREGIIIKKQENFGHFPKKGGWGVTKTKKSLKFKFGLLKPDGGVGIFQKSLNFEYLDHMGL